MEIRHPHCESPSEWFDWVDNALSDKPDALDTLEKVVKFADWRFSRMQFRVLKNDECLLLFKKAEKYKSELCQLPEYSSIKEINRMEKEQHLAKLEYRRAAECIAPGFYQAKRRYEIASAIFDAHYVGHRLPTEEISLWVQAFLDIASSN